MVTYLDLPAKQTTSDTCLHFLSLYAMSSQERQSEADGWQFDWQSWPLESGDAGPSPALPSSGLDITQTTHGQDVQPQFNFDELNYESLDFNPEVPLFDDIFNMVEPETAFRVAPAGFLEQQDQVVAVQTVAPRTRRPRAQGPSIAQWNAQKTVIQDLYMVQDKTLKETMDIMKETHDFVATYGP